SPVRPRLPFLPPPNLFFPAERARFERSNRPGRKRRRPPSNQAGLMYPLKSILVNCNESLLPVLRQALHNHPAVAEGEFSRAVAEAESRRPADVTDTCRGPQDEPRLLIYHLASIDDLEGLQRLRRTFSEWPILSLVDGCDGRSFSLLLLANRAGATQVVPTPL